MKQKWNDPPSVMIYLTDGKLAQSSINGFSFEDKSAHAFVHGREFRVMPLPAPWQDIGYGEIVDITLLDGHVIQRVLMPDEYEQHVAFVDITTSTGNSGKIIAWYRTESGWRELTQQEYVQQLQAVFADKTEMEELKQELQSYREG